MNSELLEAIRGLLAAATPEEVDRTLAAFRGEAGARTDEAVALLHAVGRTVREKLALSREVGALLRTDPLTGLANRRAFEERLELELRRSARSRRSFALAILEVDDLQAFARARGEQMAELGLCSLASAIGKHVRHVDTAARFAEHQFAMLLVDIERNMAHAIVARLLEAVRHMRFGDSFRLTVCAGVAVSFPIDTLQTIIERADAALHEARADGADNARFT